MPFRKQEPLASFHFSFQAREEHLSLSLRDISTPLISGTLHERISWGLTAQLVKNSPAMQETPVQFPGREDPCRRDRLPTPVFLGLPGGSAGKESTCNVGDLGLILGLGRSPGEGKGYPLPVFWPGEFHGLYRTWGCQESDMTEQFSLKM